VAKDADEAIGTGRSVDEAAAAAAAQLGLRPEDAELETLDEGGRGWLGLGAREARVRARRPSKGAAARRFLEGLARVLGTSVDVEVQAPAAAGEPWCVTVATEDAARWIGHRGQTLEALQVLCEAAAARVSGSRERLVLDVGGYRERREHALREMALRAAERARRLGRQVALEPMPAADRRIVHLAVREVPGVVTASVGEEPRRRVVISPRR
jgi:spoIIIJ-associated protein